MQLSHLPLGINKQSSEPSARKDEFTPCRSPCCQHSPRGCPVKHWALRPSLCRAPEMDFLLKHIWETFTHGNSGISSWMKDFSPISLVETVADSSSRFRLTSRTSDVCETGTSLHKHSLPVPSQHRCRASHDPHFGDC